MVLERGKGSNTIMGRGRGCRCLTDENNNFNIGSKRKASETSKRGVKDRKVNLFYLSAPSAEEKQVTLRIQSRLAEKSSALLVRGTKSEIGYCTPRRRQGPCRRHFSLVIFGRSSSGSLPTSHLRSLPTSHL